MWGPEETRSPDDPGPRTCPRSDSPIESQLTSGAGDGGILAFTNNNTTPEFWSSMSALLCSKSTLNTSGNCTVWGWGPSSPPGLCGQTPLKQTPSEWGACGEVHLLPADGRGPGQRSRRIGIWLETPCREACGRQWLSKGSIAQKSHE